MRDGRRRLIEFILFKLVADYHIEPVMCEFHEILSNYQIKSALEMPWVKCLRHV